MDDSPVSDISRPNATRAWTDAEYFRLLSHELPVEERDPSQLCGNLGECEDVRVPSPMSKASSRLAGDGDYLDPLGSRTASCSSSRCNSTRTSCSSTVSASYACGNRACQVPSSKWELVVGTDEQPIHGVAYEALEDRWVAFWRRSGDIHTACFSCDTYGYHRARQMAVQCRQKAEALGLTADEDKPRRASPCDPPPAVQANSRAQNASSACKHIAADQALSRAQLRQKRLHEAASAARADSDRLNSLPKVTGVRFQAQRNRFVAEWYDQGKTRMAYFPVKQYGFEEARKMAIECRKRVLVSKNQRLSCINKAGVSTRREADPPITDTKSSARRASSPPSHEVPLLWKRQCVTHPSEMSESKPRQAEPQRPVVPAPHLACAEPRETTSAEERLLLAQAALNVILIDLLSKCLPAFCGAPELAELLHKQLRCIRSASEYAQLRPYLSIVEGSIASGVLPSASTPQAQAQILMDFLEVAALRG